MKNIFIVTFVVLLISACKDNSKKEFGLDKLPLCKGSDIVCSGTNTCTDINSDTNNCGGCGHVCDKSEICSSGWCQCRQDEVYCQTLNNVNHCVSLKNDSLNCGNCGVKCSTNLQNCKMGVCTK